MYCRPPPPKPRGISHEKMRRLTEGGGLSPSGHVLEGRGPGGHRPGAQVGAHVAAAPAVAPVQLGVRFLHPGISAKRRQHLPGRTWHHHTFFSFPLQVPTPAQLKSTLQVGPATKTRLKLFQKPRETCEGDVAGSLPPVLLRLCISPSLELCSPLPVSARVCGGPQNLTLVTVLELLPEGAL